MPEYHSAQPCGCDQGEGWVCAKHRALALSAFQLAGACEVPQVTAIIEDSSTATTYVVKDSGEHQQFDSGMIRDATTDKIDYSLALDGPMFKRLAVHMTKGAQKYAARNWMLASGETELERFRTSAVRHFLQWHNNETDEDHAAAVLFNINGAEYVKELLDRVLVEFPNEEYTGD
jgi:hypothetical protein